MKSQAKKYLGMTRTMNCGLKATIIAYRKYTDIDVQFEDGTIHEHKDIDSFKKGTIIPIQAKNKYIGQTRTMNCGMKATIIAYRGFFDIDVQFENGAIREHRDIKAFRKGAIMPRPAGKKTYRIGQTRMMSCGMQATIIAYRGTNDIDIQFKDGTIREHKTMSEFNNGKIAHPTNILFDTYKLDKVAFQFHDKTYFYVTYTKNNSEISEVMCIDDMKQKLPELAQ